MDSDLNESIAALKDSLSQLGLPATFGKADPIQLKALHERFGFPLARMEERYDTRPLVAEMRLFGDATARLYAETAALDRGAVAQRIMIGFRLPF